MNTVKFRLLEPQDIDCRAAQVSQKRDGTVSACILLYKDARVDQNILDETFGIFGWQRTHQLIGERLYCTVSVKDPDTGEWISKQDVGTESNTEREKGQASDSFKRACFNWGIGRELYTAPFIWISAENCSALKQNGQRWQCFDQFFVEKIVIKNKRIKAVSIKNERTKKRCFVWTDEDYQADRTK